MTNAELLYRLLSGDAAIVSYVGVPPPVRISQERPRVRDDNGEPIHPHPALVFRSVASFPVGTFNGGFGMIPEEWAVECWAMNTVDRDGLRDAVRSRIGKYRDTTNGVQGIVLQQGGSALDTEEPFFAWSDTYMVCHLSS